tara:strand:- start:18 stop:191 length:174 start_codon:yes stop_codon:yes gene_type:complete
LSFIGIADLKKTSKFAQKNPAKQISDQTGNEYFNKIIPVIEVTNMENKGPPIKIKHW